MKESYDKDHLSSFSRRRQQALKLITGLCDIVSKRKEVSGNKEKTWKQKHLPVEYVAARLLPV